MVKQRNSRQNERAVSDAIVKLRWHGAAGEPHFAQGKILNCSKSGLRIELAEPIAVRSYITLDAPALNQAGWLGWGSVRYCSLRRSKYVIGLELSAGARWN